MKPFLDSTDALQSPAELRARAARDGYLFFRGLLPPEPLRETRLRILGVCARHGFLAPGTDPDLAIAAPGVRFREGDPEYMAAYDEIQKLETFHALAHHPAIVDMLHALFGEEVLVHPRNIARVMFPQNTQFTTPAHQDYVHIQGTEETYTAWIPLADCPVELGSLEVLPGSHKAGVLPTHGAYGAGGLGVETDHLGLEWAGGDFRCGDALFFQSLCVHRATHNQTPDRVRISVDYRYQAVSNPVVASSLLPHFNRVPWDEIYEGWTDPSLQYYWRRFDLRSAEWTPKHHVAAHKPAPPPA
jgi:hypothetical protein